MLRARITPCLLIHNKGLVKSTKFDNYKYVGDPINAVRIFNEKEVDELMVLDIDATVAGTGPDFDLIAKLAAECRMPLCYGGGVSSSEQAMKLVSIGVEKVAMSASVIDNPALIRETAGKIGSQSVVVVIDVKKHGLFRKNRIFTHNSKKLADWDLLEFASKVEQLGAGELVVNSIDCDGTMAGYDLDLARNIRSRVDLPLTILGGAGSMDDVRQLVEEFGIIGAAAGSLFVFKGPYRAVLINYPNIDQR